MNTIKNKTKEEKKNPKNTNRSISDMLDSKLWLQKPDQCFQGSRGEDHVGDYTTVHICQKSS